MIWLTAQYRACLLYTSIEDAVEDLVYGGEIVQKESMMVNNVRHIELLQQAVKSLTDALHMSERREALDFIEVDVKNAYERLGEIIGETVSDDIINEMCIRDSPFPYPSLQNKSHYREELLYFYSGAVQIHEDLLRNGTLRFFLFLPVRLSV